MEDRALLIARLRQRLLAGARIAGWPYFAGKSSRIESTCWVLLALRGSWPDGEDAWAQFSAPHFSLLMALQTPTGLLVDADAPFANLVSNGLALVALRSMRRDAAGALAALQNGLVALKGVQVAQSDDGQDNQLQGWPWVQGTFSWVEPTAWCLLALKRAGAASSVGGTEARVQDAEKLLLNRMCSEGGWNYGNASTLGQDLRPYVPTTAVGLLAMRDRRSSPDVERSLHQLVKDQLKEPSTMALALTAMCLRLYDQPVESVEERLAEVLPVSEQAGHLQALAMASYALSATEHNLEALRVGM